MPNVIILSHAEITPEIANIIRSPTFRYDAADFIRSCLLVLLEGRPFLFLLLLDFRGKVQYLMGSALVPNDLIRAGIKTARVVFVVSER